MSSPSFSPFLPPSLSPTPPCSTAQSVTNAKLGVGGDAPRGNGHGLECAKRLRLDRLDHSSQQPPSHNTHVLQEDRPPSATPLQACGPARTWGAALLSPTVCCYAHRECGSGGSAPTLHLGGSFCFSSLTPTEPPTHPKITSSIPSPHTHFVDTNREVPRLPPGVTQSAVGAAPGRAPAWLASGFDEIHTTLLKVTPPRPGPLCVLASAFSLPQRNYAAILGFITQYV